MKILELIKDQLKIDFTSTIIEYSSGSGSENPFELSAREFLRFSKSDIKSKDKRGYINALTNAKRAIDCQIDTALSLYGIDYSQIPKSSNRIVEITELNKLDLPHKLKLIQALDFAPSVLISKTRALRNKLEHYYKTPNKDEVIESIEMAELLVLSIESKIKIINDDFKITDKLKFEKAELERPYISNCIKIDFNEDSKEISLRFFKERKKIKTLKLNQNHEVFYVFIKLINNMGEQIELEETLKLFLKMIEHPIPQENINVEYY